jgi:hypothetical protein
VAIAATCIAVSCASLVPTSHPEEILGKSDLKFGNGTGGNYIPDGPAESKVEFMPFSH